MSEFTMDRLRENLEAIKMKNTLEILDNYLERAVAENLNIVDVLDHIFAEKAKSKRKRAYEKQIQMSGFPIKKNLDDFDFSFLSASSGAYTIAPRALAAGCKHHSSVVHAGHTRPSHW